MRQSATKCVENVLSVFCLTPFSSFWFLMKTLFDPLERHGEFSLPCDESVRMIKKDEHL